jgi:hypothetical protein
MVVTVRLVIACAALAATGCAEVPASSDQPSARQIEGALASARSAADALQRDLLTALTRAMAGSGPAGALAACVEKAPAIAASVSSAMSLDVGRTALRVRNPSNAPDAWEADQLAFFAGALDAGESAGRLERYAVERASEGWRVRWMRPILLQPMCTTCHGTNIDSGVMEQISALYPQDAATGFSSGELRGAFTASVPVPRN